MSRTISTNYLTGLTLTNTADSPVYVGLDVTIANPSGAPGAAALASSAPFYWSVTNGSGAHINGTSFGVSLSAAGTVVNRGTITASYSAGRGFSYDTVTKMFGILSAGVNVGGGGVSNSASGAISGVVGVALAGAGSVVNAGIIRDTVAGTGLGVILAAGGSVTNLTGGTIAGGNYGIFADASVSVSNQAGATVTASKLAVWVFAGSGSVDNQGLIGGGIFGIEIQGPTGTVVNQGSIVGTTATGVYLVDGGSVTNSNGGRLYGGFNAVLIAGASGTVSNQGVLAGATVSGVYLVNGGSVANQSGGTIKGGDAGVIAGVVSTATVTNKGVIQQLNPFATQTYVIGGVLLLDGGTVDNASGTIISTSYGVYVTKSAGTVTNTGLISSSRQGGGAGVALGTGGTVANGAGGIIDGQWIGVSLKSGGSVTNSLGGTLTGGSAGVLIAGAPGTVSNQGIATGATIAGISFAAGGTVSNLSGGTITGGAAGIRVGTVSSGSVTNQGLIEQLTPVTTQTYALGGVVLLDGGSVSNNGGTITSLAYGVLVANAGGTVTNTGVIFSSQQGAGAGIDLLNGGSVTNGAGGIIDGEWIGVQFGTFGSIVAPPATLDNHGTISASDGTRSGAAVWVHGPGVLINRSDGVIQGSTNGTIVGGPLNGKRNGGFGVVAYYQTTLINYGSIGGGVYAFDAANKNPTNTDANLIEMAPGATFGGAVLASRGIGSATLELLSGASAGSVENFGTYKIGANYYQGYLGFNAVKIDDGARWKLGGVVGAGTNVTFTGKGELTLASATEMQGAITHFAQGDTIEIDGLTATGSSYAGGVLTLDEAAGGPVTLALPGTFTTGDFVVTSSGGNTRIGIPTTQNRTLSWTGAASAAFNSAANWKDLTNGLGPARTVPNATDTVVFDTGNGAVAGTATVAAVDVGSAGNGVLQLANGVTLAAGSLDAGITSPDVGQVGLSGAGTRLIVNGPATIADDGTGVLSVLNGATFTASDLTVGAKAHGSGALVVSGIGSLVNLTGVLNIGTPLGTGDLTVGPGASIHASVVTLLGGVVLEGGNLDPDVLIEAKGKTAGGIGTIGGGAVIDEGTILASGTRPGNALQVVAGTIIGGGTLLKDGLVQQSSTAGVLMLTNVGTMELTGPVLNAATTTVTDALTTTGTYVVKNSVIDVAFQDVDETLIIDDIAGFGGTITTFNMNDAFVIAGGTLSNLGASNSKTLTVQDGTGTDRIMFNAPIDPAWFSVVNGNTIEAISCFAAGTMIETETGPVAVEFVTTGDRIRTLLGGSGQVIWVGSRVVDCARHPRPVEVWPVRIARGAFADNLPARDLFVSPDHAVFIEGVLIPAHCLINGGTIQQMPAPTVTYYHVELTGHDVILAEGLPVESYLDTGNRANFSNFAGTVKLFPDFSARMWEMAGCAPLVIAGPVLQRVRHALAQGATLGTNGVLLPGTRPRAPWSRLNNRYTYY